MMKKNKKKTNPSKLVAAILMLILIASTLSACNGTNNSSGDEPFEHIADENTHGYYFDLYTKDSKDKERNGIIELKTYSDEMYFDVESAGAERQLSVRIFVDYEQVPIIIKNQVYDTFLIEANDNYSEKFSFQLAQFPDDQYNHSMTAILTAGSDIYTSQVDFEMSDDYSIALNHMLMLGQDKPMVEPIYKYDETQTVTEYESTGLLINSDVTENERAIPDRELSVKTGEKFALQYQAGGYKNCDDVAIIITIGSKQAEINGQKYLLCKTANGELVHGIANLQAPTVAGLYEIMGWVVKEPFGSNEPEFLPLDMSYRFTLNVK